jgi:hypothetical protein
MSSHKSISEFERLVAAVAAAMVTASLLHAMLLLAGRDLVQLKAAVAAREVARERVAPEPLESLVPPQ